MNKVSYLTLGTLSLTLAVFASGCGQSGSSFSTLPTGQTFKQGAFVTNNKIDILWVVDNSGSMGPLQTNMTNNFNSFISDIVAKGYDYHIAVTTTDAYLADTNLVGYYSGNAPMAKFRDGVGSTHTNVFTILPTTPNLIPTFVTNASQGSNGDGDERAFSSMKVALNSPLNSGFLRPDSFFAVIILSDEDDFSSASRIQDSMIYSTTSPYYVSDHNYNYSGLDTVNSYVSYLDTLTSSTGATRRYNVSSLTVLDSTCLASHVSASPSSIIGQRYIQLTGATNGVTGSICDTSYANSLIKIQNQIKELSTQFFLTQVPIINTIVVQIDGATISTDPANGWTYNSTANSIVFHGTAIPAQGANINISFIPQSLTGN